MDIDPVIAATIEELHEKLGHPDIDAEARKIAKKLIEARYNPGDATPLADCIVAILVAGRNQGFSPATMMQAVRNVCEKLSSREWKRMADGTWQAQ